MAAELEDLHLADLHQRAATAGMSGYRKLDRDALIEALAEAPESEEVVVEATVLDDKAPEPVELGSEGAEGGDVKGEALPTEEVRGVLELTGQRHGFLRLAGLGPSDGDVYISAAQVRRCGEAFTDRMQAPRLVLPGERAKCGARGEVDIQLLRHRNAIPGRPV